MAYFNHIKINGNDIYRPNDFTPERTDVYAAEFETMTGKIRADLIGWKYADMTMQWDSLPEDQLHVLMNMIGNCTIEFNDSEGKQIENIARKSAVEVATRHIGPDGKPLWKNVSVAIRFLDAHN